MSATKYLVTGSDGYITEESAIETSAGSADEGKIVSLNGAGKIDDTMLSVGPDTCVAPASENLAAGDLVNLHLVSSTLKVRKADASGGVAKKCDGYVSAAFTSGADATVYLDGTITGLSGLTKASNYFLSATAPGAADTVIPSTTGHIVQPVGKGKSATELIFEMGEPIVRA